MACAVLPEPMLYCWCQCCTAGSEQECCRHHSRSWLCACGCVHVAASEGLMLTCWEGSGPLKRAVAHVLGGVWSSQKGCLQRGVAGVPGGVECQTCAQSRWAARLMHSAQGSSRVAGMCLVVRSSWEGVWKGIQAGRQTVTRMASQAYKQAGRQS